MYNIYLIACMSLMCLLSQAEHAMVHLKIQAKGMCSQTQWSWACFLPSLVCDLLSRNFGLCIIDVPLTARQPFQTLENYTYYTRFDASKKQFGHYCETEQIFDHFALFSCL